LERKGYKDMGTLEIKYCFRLPDDKEEVFHLELDVQSLELVRNIPENPPQWIRLGFHQCPNCPLTSHTHPNCPLMLNLFDIVWRFDHLLSYDEISMEVIMGERCISCDTTAQRGISSLMGIMIASSGCPHTVFFKPMVRFHLPLATEEETIFRAASMYLLAQYFLQKEGRKADFELNGLEQIYQNMHLVNTAIATRLRDASKTDSSVNALIMLDMYAKAMPYAIEESLEEIRYLFKSYLTDRLEME
jgi:uncharacterized protein DUF6901